MDNWGQGTCTLAVARLYRPAIGLSLLLLLVLTCSAGTVYAQSAEQREQSTQSGGQTGAMQGQGSMEGMREGQGSMMQMT